MAATDQFDDHDRNVTAANETAHPTETAPEPRRGWWRMAALAGGAALLIAAGFTGPVIAITVLLALITLHEVGHLLAAKALGLRATEFFVGFGPTVWSFRRGETTYGVKSLFLGGYVKIAGMDPATRDDPRGYGQAPRWKRYVVVAAGPATNLLIGFVLAVVVLGAVGLPGAPKNTLADVDPTGPAAAAGLRAGDQIVAVDGTSTNDFAAVVDGIVSGGDTVVMTVDRHGTVSDYTVDVLAGEDGRRIGIIADVDTVTLGAVDSFTGGGELVWQMSLQSLEGISNVVVGIGETMGGLVGAEVDPEQRPISPIGAVQVGVEIGGQGLAAALLLIMIYSIFLAVFNLLPIPPLDGGHIAINVYESVASKVRGRPVVAEPSTVGAITITFVGAILVLGVVAVVLDITQPISL